MLYALSSSLSSNPYIVIPSMQDSGSESIDITDGLAPLLNGTLRSSSSFLGALQLETMLFLEDDARKKISTFVSFLRGAISCIN